MICAYFIRKLGNAAAQKVGYVICSFCYGHLYQKAATSNGGAGAHSGAELCRNKSIDKSHQVYRQKAK